LTHLAQLASQGLDLRRTVETELFLFLTPRILETDEDADRATDAVREAAPEVGKRLPRPLLPPDTATADTAARAQ
jgi:type II secretory pathway component GspD/PulD (secretin)